MDPVGVEPLGANAAIPHGSVWPVATLFGASLAAAAALGAWIAAWIAGLPRPWFVLDWMAEHALWGTLVGVALACLLRCVARFDPTLSDAGRRRAAAARLSATCVALGLVALAAQLAGRRGEAWESAAIELLGAGLGLWCVWMLLGRRLAGAVRFDALPRLDPARVAVGLALLTLPLAAGIRRLPLDGPSGAQRPEIAARVLPASLLEAWQVMLGQ
jgi:hypothetical protein